MEPEADGDADGVPAFGGVQKGHEQLMTMGVLLLSGNILHHTRPRRLKVPVCAVCGKQLKHLQVAPVVTAGDLKSDPIRARVVRVHTWWGWLGSAPRTRSARTAFGCPLKHANNNRYIVISINTSGIDGPDYLVQLAILDGPAQP